MSRLARLRAALLAAKARVLATSIRTKIAGTLLGVLVLATASLALASFSQMKRTLEDETRLRAAVLARELAGASRTALLTDDDVTVLSAIRDLERTANARSASVLDRKGVVFADSLAERRGAMPDSPFDRAARQASETTFQRVALRDGWGLEAAAPITARLGRRVIRVGTARVTLSLRPLQEAIGRERAAFLAITSLYLGLALLLSVGLGRLLTRRLVLLMQSMKGAAAGDLDHLVATGPGDEIGALARCFNEMILDIREKLKMEKYLSGSTLQLIKSNRDERAMRLGGERRHVAVLFSDIRGFTALAETLEPEEVVSLLNIYLNLQAEVVYSRGGVVDKFVGDEVMALFTGEDCEYRAALAAREILNFVHSLNEVRARLGKRTMRVGIGLNAGQSIMGNMGSERQMDYTVIGDPVNTAARLGDAAQAGQAVMSRAVAQALGERCAKTALAPLRIKGKRELFEVWELTDLPGTARRHMRKAVRLDGRCRFEGSDGLYPMRVHELSRGGCAVETQAPLTEGARLALTLPLEALADAELRAVVRRAAERDGRCLAALQFEDAPAGPLDALTEWVHAVVTAVAAAPAAARRIATADARAVAAPSAET